MNKYCLPGERRKQGGRAAAEERTGSRACRQDPWPTPAPQRWHPHAARPPPSLPTRRLPCSSPCLPRRSGAGIGHEGARALVETVRAAGLATAVASSADRVKIDASLAAAEIPQTLFGTIVSADAFERLKPAPGARGRAVEGVLLNVCRTSWCFPASLCRFVLTPAAALLPRPPPLQTSSSPPPPSWACRQPTASSLRMRWRACRRRGRRVRAPVNSPACLCRCCCSAARLRHLVCSAGPAAV